MNQPPLDHERFRAHPEPCCRWRRLSAQEEQGFERVKRLLCHQKAARWKKEKSRRVRPSTVCLKKEEGQIKLPKWARTTC
jgi:hypothetical protein